MKKEWLVKTLALGIVVFLIGLNIVSAESNISMSFSKVETNIVTNNEFDLFPKIIYVDDDNIEGPWEGTILHPYEHIKDGIDAAENGDTVFVFNGIYRECYLRVEKSIYILGENKDNTIIDGGGSFCSTGFTVIADGVKIHGFTIRNCEFEHGRGRGITIYANRCIISGNKIINNGEYGISVAGMGGIIGSVYNLIKNNIITNHNIGGILIWYTRGNRIIGNHIESNADYGIFIGSGYFNTYKLNNFIDNNCNAYFEFSIGNRWYRNYWDDWNGAGLYKIKGIITIIRFFPEFHLENIKFYNYDWHPAKEPYNIPI